MESLARKLKKAHNFKRWSRDNADHRREYKCLWNQRNKDKVSKYNRDGRMRHLATRKERDKQYRINNADSVRSRMRLYHKRTYPQKRERLLQQTKEYAKLHPEVRRRAYLNYVNNHPERIKLERAVNNARISAQRRGALVGDKTIGKVIKQWRSKQTFRCYYCGKRFSVSCMQVDHVKAVAVGGTHSADNISKSCRTCNIRKRHHSVTSLLLEQPLLGL